jgi:AraC-like DNA-binding protein
MADEATRPLLQTAIGFAAKWTIAALVEHSVDPAPVLERAGLAEHDFDNPQFRIPAAAQCQIMEFASEALKDSAFGLHLATQTNPRGVGMLFYVTAAAMNVGEGIGLFARYCRIVNEAMRFQLTREEERSVLAVSFAGVPRHRARQYSEFAIALAMRALREITARHVRPVRVSFAHGRNSDLPEFRAFYGCPVEFGAPSDRLVFSNETLALPLITEDRFLLDALRPICDAAARERHTPTGTLRESVESEVQKLLPHGRAQRQTVAKALAVSSRTLSRRLADEGTTYEEILDRLRRSLALEYVKEPNLSVSQIAWLLGYEGATSLNHAFRRWTGRSPSLARNEPLAPGFGPASG